MMSTTQVLYLRSFALFRNSTFSPLSPHFFDLKISRYFESLALQVTKKKVLTNIFFCQRYKTLMNTWQ